MHSINPELLSPIELADLCHKVASSGFSPKVAKDLSAYFVKFWIGDKAKDFTQLRSGEAARLFYALAIMDADSSSAELMKLAQAILLHLNNKFVSLNFNSSSHIYHALKYFENRYPLVTWTVNKSFRARLNSYESVLKEDGSVTQSNTQHQIYTRMLLLNPGFKYEAFIEKAGRRVDISLENNVIQYNGIWRHYFYFADGQISHESPADLLCRKTLECAGYKVVTIDHQEWRRVRANDESQVSLFQSKIPDVVSAAKSASTLFRESIPEVKTPAPKTPTLK